VLGEKLEADTLLSAVISAGAPVAGTPAIARDALPELHQDLERQRLVPLWEIACGFYRASHSREPSRTSGAGPTLRRWPSAQLSWSPSSAAVSGG
jgi:hypothetical protein